MYDRSINQLIDQSINRSIS